MNSSFLKIVSEIESARIAGFIRPALYESISLIDLCGKVEYQTDKTRERFINWTKRYLYDDTLAYAFWNIPISERLNSDEDKISEYVETTADKFANEIYQLRCNLFHEGTVDNRKDRGDKKRVSPLQLYEITPMSSCGVGVCIMKNPNEPYQYQPVDIGLLIEHICRKAKMYYESGTASAKQTLDEIDEFFVDQRNDDFFEEIGKVWTVEKLSKRSQ